MSEEEIYTFNEYILVCEKGNNDRSCLTISKIINGDMYVMSSLYDGSVDVISMILDNLQKENKQLKEQVEYLRRSIERKESTISEMEQERIPYTNEYVKHLEQQLQQKEDIINKAKEYIKPKLNMKNKDGFPFLLFKRTHAEKILEILDRKE